MTELLVRIGAQVIAATYAAGYTVILLWQAILWFPWGFKKRRTIAAQMFICGVQSLIVTMVVAAFSGMILALSTGIELRKYGQERVVGAVVSITMCREMGPLMTALILAANVGSAMAAELGTMKVSEEIDALEVLSIDPARFLVMPRVLAMLIMTPVLTVLSDFMGNVGGAIVAFYRLGVGYDVYYDQAVDILNYKAIYTGLFKSVVFGLVISSVSCAQGLRAENGAIGVGQAVRNSVIIGFLLVIILGYFITAMFYSMGPAGPGGNA